VRGVSQQPGGRPASIDDRNGPTLDFQSKGERPAHARLSEIYFAKLT
jgi:hypothetical protein